MKIKILKMATQDTQESVARKIASAQKQIEEWNVLIEELLKEPDYVEVNGIGRKEHLKSLFEKEINWLNGKIQQFQGELGTKAEKTNNFKISP